MPIAALAWFQLADAQDFKGFVAWLRANPGKTTFGVPSNGTIPHFTGSRLERGLGVLMTRVAYRGSAAAINDLIGGHLPFAIVGHVLLGDFGH